MAMKVRYTVVNGEVLSENRGGVKRDYLPDTQGNTIGLIDNTQAITDTFSYYPYGEVASRTGTTATPFQFLGTLGYYRDSASRTYVRARTLNTAQGRWMTQDPIGFQGGDVNLYRYVNNRPTVLVDPSGNDFQEVCDASPLSYQGCLACCAEEFYLERKRCERKNLGSIYDPKFKCLARAEEHYEQCQRRCEKHPKVPPPKGGCASKTTWSDCLDCCNQQQEGDEGRCRRQWRNCLEYHESSDVCRARLQGCLRLASENGTICVSTCQLRR